MDIVIKKAYKILTRYLRPNSIQLIAEYNLLQAFFLKPHKATMQLSMCVNTWPRGIFRSLGIIQEILTDSSSKKRNHFRFLAIIVES